MCVCHYKATVSNVYVFSWSAWGVSPYPVLGWLSPKVLALMMLTVLSALQNRTLYTAIDDKAKLLNQPIER